MASSNNNDEIFKVGIRVPPFWPEEPEIWFAQEVKDIIISPPPTEKYEKLKTELIKRLSASREKQVKQLLMHEELGDRRPSQFLRHLQSLAGPNVPEDFLKTIWTSRLPRNVQTVIAAQPTASLEVLSDLADRIQDIAPATPQVSAASTCGSSLANEIAELRRQMKVLMDRQSRPRSCQRSRSRSETRSESNYRKFPKCWYHAKFGAKAKRCVKPCDYIR
ncbi:uncharacterized protein LOC128200273 [Galleria mellonella]|uniref:Uncharacterized protein LOC128200273 n=1 Tax=Galleria mellonella TaxID=7137 RepID=A0ABM3MCK7_GALME|nr:uncharacterized protein LOC128200273 [Galleria mellonella]